MKIFNGFNLNHFFKKWNYNEEWIEINKTEYMSRKNKAETKDISKEND